MPAARSSAPATTWSSTTGSPTARGSWASTSSTPTDRLRRRRPPSREHLADGGQRELADHFGISIPPSSGLGHSLPSFAVRVRHPTNRLLQVDPRTPGSPPRHGDRGGSRMGQMYLQRFAYRDGVSKSEFDETWAEAFRAFARSGNWGGVDKEVTHHKTYGTGWGAGRLQSPEWWG